MEEALGVVESSVTTIKFDGITFNIKSTKNIFYPTGVKGKQCNYVIVKKEEGYFKRAKP